MSHGEEENLTFACPWSVNTVYLWVVTHSWPLREDFCLLLFILNREVRGHSQWQHSSSGADWMCCSRAPQQAGTSLHTILDLGLGESVSLLNCPRCTQGPHSVGVESKWNHAFLYVVPSVSINFRQEVCSSCKQTFTLACNQTHVGQTDSKEACKQSVEDHQQSQSGLVVGWGRGISLAQLEVNKCSRVKEQYFSETVNTQSTVLT